MWGSFRVTEDARAGTLNRHQLVRVRCLGHSGFTGSGLDVLRDLRLLMLWMILRRGNHGDTMLPGAETHTQNIECAVNDVCPPNVASKGEHITPQVPEYRIPRLKRSLR